MLNLTCIKCGEVATLTVDLDDGDTITCPACDESYSVADVRAVVEGWTKILPWLLAHPARTGGRVAAGAK